MMLTRSKKDRAVTAVGVDIGSRQIKVVVVKKEAGKLELSNYAVVSPTGSVRKNGGAELQGMSEKLGLRDRHLRVAMSCTTATVSEVELPRMPLEDVRAALKLNGQRYLRRDLANYLLDVVELPAAATEAGGKGTPKMRLLVAAASQEEVHWCRDALLGAKIRPEVVELSAIAVVNAFQICNPETCARGIVMLLDIGAASTSINFLRDGIPVMTRIMSFGGDQISEFIGQGLTLQPEAAEQQKLQMPEDVKPLVRQSLSTLAREVRASIDYFERQQDVHVAAMHACGGSACSPAIIEFLSEEIGSHIEVWNPIGTFNIALENGEATKLATIAPSLAAAVGAAVAQF